MSTTNKEEAPVSQIVGPGKNLQIPAAPAAPIVTTDNLILVGPGYTLQIPAEAVKRRDSLIAQAATIKAIVTPEDAENAQAIIKELGGLRNQVEAGRKLVKAPVIELGRDIDAKAKEFGDPAAIEEKRVSALYGGYATEVERQRREAELEARRKEQERIEAERKAEAARLAEEERQRKAAEDKAKAEAAAAEAAAKAALADEDDIEAQIAAEEAAIAKREAERKAAAEAEAAAKAEEARQAEAARLAAEHRSAAIQSRQGVKGASFPLAFEVTDIAELYRTHPHLVTLTVKTADVKTFLKAEEAKLNGGIPTVPGLRVFRDVKVRA